MTMKIKDWTGYTIVWASFDDPQDSIVVLRHCNPKSYVVKWKHSDEAIMSHVDVSNLAQVSKLIPPKRVIIQKFFADE